MELTADRQAKFSTTQYILYGEVEATIRHDPVQGLVAAFVSRLGLLRFSPCEIPIFANAC